MPVDVRVASNDDLASLRVRLSTSDIEFIRSRIPQGTPGRVIVAVTGGDLVGTVVVSWAPADEPEIRERYPGVPIMYWLRVDEPYRRDGIGTRLIRKAEQLVREQGDRRVLIGVDQVNVLARRLYRSLGYRAELTVPGGVNGPYDILVADL